MTRALIPGWSKSIDCFMLDPLWPSVTTNSFSLNSIVICRVASRCAGTFSQGSWHEVFIFEVEELSFFHVVFSDIFVNYSIFDVWSGHLHAIIFNVEVNTCVTSPESSILECLHFIFINDKLIYFIAFKPSFLINQSAIEFCDHN